MRILLVDNGTKHLEGLKQITERHDVTIVSPEELGGVDYGQYDCAILSGSYNHSVVSGQEYYAAELELIKSGTLPVLGICVGFELICYAFGAELSKLADKIEGAGRITPTSHGEKIFQGSDPIRVTEAHRWCVEELPKVLVKLATSETGIEAIKHRTLPIYGLQFHPEDFTYSSDGKLVFENIMDTFRK